MKFGQHLDQALYAPWRFYYLDYDRLKKELKAQTAKGGFQEDDEAAFVESMERELEKVAAFRSIKGDELTRRIQHSEAVVESMSVGGLGESPSDSTRYANLEGECNRIIVELTELSKFVRLNYSGFIKILKKHDKHTTYQLKPMFMVRLNSRPFYKENFNSLVIRISRLYDLVRTGGHPSTPQVSSSVGGGSQQFVRRTTKYWVHPDNVFELKCIMLKYLPVLVFGGKGGKDFDPAITSIYFDNDDFDLYNGRLEKTEGAEAIRLRWYGNMDQQEIFIERKTHREDWTGESSVKSRFPIKEKYVNRYLASEYSLEHQIEKYRARNQKTESELKELELLSSEIQDSIRTRNLSPKIRTFYNRTAFQLPGDARVRISLDTELSMIREDNEDRPRAGPNWRRTDIGTDFPFSQLPDDDICRFPYAILEVKLQTQSGTTPPKWIQELIASHLVEEVPKFSKFIHGVSTLLEQHVSLLPFWLPQMDKDIRKPARSADQSMLALDSPPRLRKAIPSMARPMAPAKDVIQVIVDGGSDAGPEGASALGIDAAAATEHTPLLYNGGPRLRPKAKSVLFPAWSAFFRKRRQSNEAAAAAPGLFAGLSAFAARSGGSGPGGGGGPPRARNSHSGRHAKRIALPVRVEPKVFFANERTFLQWCHFCITLGSLSLGLLNFGDRVGQISGLIFTIVAMIFMVYATFLFQWRAQMIRNRAASGYDDRVGPTVLVTVLFFAILVNFWLKFTQE